MPTCDYSASHSTKAGNDEELPFAESYSGPRSLSSPLPWLDAAVVQSLKQRGEAEEAIEPASASESAVKAVALFTFCQSQQERSASETTRQVASVA